MSHGPARDRLESYLTGAREDAIDAAALDWKNKADLLAVVGRALAQSAPTVESEIGADTLTGPAIRKAFETSGASMQTKAQQLSAGGDALLAVAQTLARARTARDSMADLQAPPPYTAPYYPPGSPPTPAQITQDGQDRQAANAAQAGYQRKYTAQETASADWTQKLDQAFLGAIPPMAAIHGSPDPTIPPTGPGGGGGGGDAPGSVPAAPTPGPGPGAGTNAGTNAGPNAGPGAGTGAGPGHLPAGPGPGLHPDPGQSPGPGGTHVTHPGGPTTSVPGAPQTGVDYEGRPASPTPTVGSSHGSAAATSAGIGGGLAAGAAGGALGSGLVRGTTPGGRGGATSGTRAGAVKGIGSTTRPAGSSSLGRAASTGGTAGKPSSPSRSGSTTRGGAAKGGAGGRGVAGSRGASTGSTSGKGGPRSRLGGSTAGGRGARRDEDEQAQRDAMVYEQDWLGDDSAAPGVLD